MNSTDQLADQLADLLSRFASAIAATNMPVIDVLDDLIRRTMQMLPITSAAITVTLPGVAPRYIAVSDPTALLCEEIQTDTHDGPRTVISVDGAAVAVPDLTVDDRFPRFATRAKALGLASAFSFPMMQGPNRFGALDLYSTSPGSLGAEQVHAAHALAAVASAYLLSATTRASLGASSAREHQLASHDALTGLANRALLVRRLDKALADSAPGRTSVAALYLDFDLFKMVNESFGHDVGDSLLVAIAARLGEFLRDGHSLGCLGGDQFVVVCGDLEGSEDAVSIAQRLLLELSRPFVLGTQTVQVTASLGIAFAGRGDGAAERVLQDASTAMQQAKQLGGDRYELFEISLHVQAVARSEMIRELRRAVEQKEFCLHYQPVVALDGRVCGLEALIRWQHPSRGTLYPADFISILEDTGLIVEVGAWTLDQACRDLARWRALPNRSRLTMAVNLSGRQLLEHQLTSTVAATLMRYGLPPKALCLEMTESVLMDDSALVTDALNSIHDLGVRLAVDDFGTGYSSLLYLRRFPVDALKLDRLFVAGIDRNSQDPAIVRAVIDLAHSLGLVAVAEGVETAAQLSALTEMECDFAQGFHWSPGVPGDQVDGLLTRIALEPIVKETWPLAAPWPAPAGERAAPTRRSRDLASVVIANSSQNEIGQLYSHLEASGAFRVVADATNARSAVSLAERTKPDIVVLDMAMPTVNGLQILPYLLRASPISRVVLLLDEPTDEITEAAMTAGAAAVLRKGDSLSVLVERLCELTVATPAELAISPEAWWVLGRSTID